MKRTAVFYGPVGGSTERIARKVHSLIGEDKCDLVAVRDAGLDEIARYENIVFGLSSIGTETWQAEPVKSGWFTFINTLEKADLGGKKIAIFGLGDQIRYANHFVDAMGELYKLIASKGMDTVGKVDPVNYQFNDSEAMIGGKFVGLPVDEDFQAELTDERIREWVGQLMLEFK